MIHRSAVSARQNGVVRHKEFLERTGLDATTLSRFVTRGVVQPTYPWGRGSGRPALYSEVDRVAALVRVAVAVNNEAVVADAVALASRTGSPYLVYAARAAIGCPSVVEAVGWLEELGAGVLVDVARVLEVAEPAAAVEQSG